MMRSFLAGLFTLFALSYGAAAQTSGIIVNQTPVIGGTAGECLTITGGHVSAAACTAGVLLGANGGTGVANTGKTITLGGNLTTSGAYASTFTASGAFNYTLPPASGQMLMQDGSITPGNLVVFSATGKISDSGLTPISSIGANTFLGNFTAGTAAPGTTSIPACTTALGYTSPNFTCASQTGTGTTLVAQTSPALTTPSISSVAIASLPAATTAGQIVRASNFGTKGALLMADGTRWKPLNGYAVLSTLDTQSSNVNGTEANVLSYAMPAGLWKAGDRIRFYYGLIKSGAVDTGTYVVRIGPGSACGDTAIVSVAALGSAANRQVAQFFDILLVSATTAILLPSSRTVGYGAASNNAYDSAVTIPNATTTGFNINVCIKSGGATDTVALTHNEITYISSAN